MTRRTRGLALAAGFVIALSTGTSAGAHLDPTPDAAPCDTWSRDGHPGGHDHSSSNDLYLPADGGHFHNHGGHYSVSSDSVGYIEIVGGQGYNNGNNQGGWVQGEIDPGVGVDADFQFNSFAGPNQPYAEGGVCVNVAEIRVG